MFRVGIFWEARFSTGAQMECRGSKPRSGCEEVKKVSTQLFIVNTVQQSDIKLVHASHTGVGSSPSINRRNLFSEITAHGFWS